MGVWVGYPDRMIWSPGMWPGRLFIRHVEALEQVFETRSGVTTPMADTVEIAPPVLAAFIRDMLGILE